MRTIIKVFGAWLIGFVTFLHVNAQAVPDEETLPGKEKLSKDLVMLRDSVNGTISMLSQQDINVADPLRPAYLKMTQDLNKQKVQLDRAIDDVVRNEWTVDVKTRTSQVIDDARREYKRILSELNPERKQEQ